MKTPVEPSTVVPEKKVTASVNGMDAPHLSSAADPVARSREQLHHYLAVNKVAQRAPFNDDVQSQERVHPQPSHAAADEQSLLWDTALAFTAKWWDEQPWGRAVKPLITHYEHRIRAQPISTLAVAAACGAALVILRPWRLVVAVSAVSAALNKSNAIGQVIHRLMPQQHISTPTSSGASFSSSTSHRPGHSTGSSEPPISNLL
jgi:hypothetical protein